MENEAGRYTLVFLGAPGDEGGEVELTYNWDESGYDGGRNFGHLAYQVDEPAVGPAYHSPAFGIDVHGSAGWSAAPF